MFDIHSHILPFIDDGSPDIESSLKMLKEAIDQGVKNIILTPHILREDVELYSKQDLLKQFEQFKDIVKNNNLEINLYLGQEIHYNNKTIKYLKNNELFGLDDSELMLVELPFSESNIDFLEMIHNFNVMGKQIVLAHVERYDYLNVKQIEILKENGILIQLNSNSITGRAGSRFYKKSIQLLKKSLVDFVASDIHSFRTYDLREAYLIIDKKFGKSVAEKIFYVNPTLFLNK